MNEAIVERWVKQHFPQCSVEYRPQCCIQVPKDLLHTFMKTIKKALKVDYLIAITAVDFGPKQNKMGLYYHLQSICEGYCFYVECLLERDNPEVVSISDIWLSALWHEREAYDLFGIRFKNHPDLRRILMPEDWQGHPMRKDYQEPELYHGIFVQKENPEKGGKPQ